MEINAHSGFAAIISSSGDKVMSAVVEFHRNEWGIIFGDFDEFTEAMGYDPRFDCYTSYDDDGELIEAIHVLGVSENEAPLASMIATRWPTYCSCTPGADAALPILMRDRRRFEPEDAIHLYHLINNPAAIYSEFVANGGDVRKAQHAALKRIGDRVEPGFRIELPEVV